MGDEDGVAFAQWNMDDIECYNLREHGHYASQCPNPAKEDKGGGESDGANTKQGSNMMMFTFSQGDEPEIRDTWIV